MGMYDELTCAYPLPRPEMQGRTFQTKNFDCSLEMYQITAEGHLMCHPHHLERNPEWKEPAPDNRSFTALFGMFLHVDDPPFRIEHHGDVYFYDFEEDGANSGLITFRARFTEGVVTGITEVHHDH